MKSYLGSLSLVAMSFFFSSALANDPCAATLLTTPPDSCFYIQGSTFLASGSIVNSLPCSGVSGKPDYWYSVIVPQCGPDLTVNLLGGSGASELTFGTLYLYTGSCNSLTSLSCTPLTGPSYLASRTLTSLNGGDTIFIRVRDVTSSGNYLLCVFGSCPTGIQMYPALQMLQVFPNPASDEFSIRGTLANGKSVIEIFDATGRCVYSQKPEKSSSLIKFNISFLEAGIYTMQIRATDFMETKKFIVTR